MKIPLKVERVVCTEIGILMVFYTPAKAWQFCCIYRSGLIKQTSQIFSSWQKAEIEGRWWGDRCQILSSMTAEIKALTN